MLYRLLVATVVVFWVTMTGLLMRKEFGPRDTVLREVPVTHVLKTMLTHEQPSDLEIYNDKLTVGRLHLRPHLRDGQRRVDLSGTLQVLIPGLARQAVAWSGEWDLDDRLETQRLKIAISVREPAGFTVDLLLAPGDRFVSYESRIRGQLIKRARYSLDEQGVNEWLRSEGIDPAWLAALRQSQTSALTVKARQSSLDLRGEKIGTYLVSAEQGEQTMLEAHVSQLGQILRVRTFAGYSAAPENLLP